MHRRVLFPLAAGIVGLVAISPALAAGPAPLGAKKPGPAKATTTTNQTTSAAPRRMRRTTVSPKPIASADTTMAAERVNSIAASKSSFTHASKVI